MWFLRFDGHFRYERPVLRAGLRDYQEHHRTSPICLAKAGCQRYGKTFIRFRDAARTGAVRVSSLPGPDVGQSRPDPARLARSIAGRARSLAWLLPASRLGIRTPHDTIDNSLIRASPNASLPHKRPHTGLWLATRSRPRRRSIQIAPGEPVSTVQSWHCRNRSVRPLPCDIRLNKGGPEGSEIDAERFRRQRCLPSAPSKVFPGRPGKRNPPAVETCERTLYRPIVQLPPGRNSRPHLLSWRRPTNPQCRRQLPDETSSFPILPPFVHSQFWGVTHVDGVTCSHGQVPFPRSTGTLTSHNFDDKQLDFGMRVWCREPESNRHAC